MLIKILACTNSTSNEDFSSLLKKRVYLFFIPIILGILTLVLAYIFSVGNHAYLSPFLSGFYSGVGSGCIAAGIIKMIQTKRILKDQNRIKEQRLKEQDERNQLIVKKATNTATILFLIMTYIALLVSGIFNLTVFWTLLTIVFVFSILVLILHGYYNIKL